MDMEAFLISAQSGDRIPGGIDVALLDDIDALKGYRVQEWMTAQGYGLDDPDKCMYLAVDPPASGFNWLKVILYADDTSRYRAVIADRLRQYGDLEAEREDLVRAAAAVQIPKRQIALMARMSRQTVYNILGEDA